MNTTDARMLGAFRNGGNTAGIRLDASDTLPASWTSHLDFGATGSAPLLKHNKLSLNADGTANWAPEVKNPPRIKQPNASVTDNGSNDVYSITWKITDVVTSAESLFIECYRNGVLAASGTVSDPTTLSTSITDTGGGDGISDDHFCRLFLKDAAGDVIQSIDSLTRPSAI